MPKQQSKRHLLLTTAMIGILFGSYCFLRLAVVTAAPGDLDTTFAGTGKTRTAFGLGNDEGKAVVVQPDGKLVVAGSSQNGPLIDFLVIRYNTDGSLDPRSEETEK